MALKTPWLFLLILITQWAYAQKEANTSSINYTPEQQEVVNLSRQKWNWMAERDVVSLNMLFDNKSMFVHMGGSWGKDQEIEIIKNGSIWYRKAEVYSILVNIIGSTAILLTDIDLLAVVSGNEVVNPFMVTEVYIKENGKWVMGSLTFSRLTRPVKMNNNAQQMNNSGTTLSAKQRSIISIASLATKGDTDNLKTALNTGLESGLTINEIKEVLVHLYAYCGFPRSIRGLQTFMQVIEERKIKGITDNIGRDASPVTKSSTKYERGKKILSELTGTLQPATLPGYAAFAPVIDTFLKKHLFADIFERDVLTYAQRELITISAIATIGNADPMLRGHLSISLNVGITPEQLQEFIIIIRSTGGEKESKAAQAVLESILKSRKQDQL